MSSMASSSEETYDTTLDSYAEGSYPSHLHDSYHGPKCFFLYLYQLNRGEAGMIVMKTFIISIAMV